MVKKNSRYWFKIRKTSSNSDYFVSNVTKVDYKDVTTLNKFINKQGRIISRADTRLNAKNQRLVAKAIKRARQEGLMSYTIVEQNE